MRKIISFMHVTLDGFVGKPNWKDFSWPKLSNETFEFVAQITSGAITPLYGRVTFQGMEAYWSTAGEQPGATQHDIEHSRWYKQVEKVVLSTTLEASDFRNTTVIAENAAEQIRALKQKAGQDFVIFGSPGAVHTLMAADLIDEYCLMINPVLLGEGIPMFRNIQTQTELRLLETKTHKDGVIFVRYAKV